MKFFRCPTCFRGKKVEDNIIDIECGKCGDDIIALDKGEEVSYGTN